MADKKIAVAAAVAGAAIIAAWFAGKGAKTSSAAAPGENLVPDFDLAKVARLEVGTNTVLCATDKGWVARTMQDYPANRSKITENLLKLKELKAGQVVRGKTLKEKTIVKASDASGKELFSLVLGERHEKWGLGRYAEYKGQAVLTGESLDAFGDSVKSWCDTKIVDDPWISFNALAPKDAADSVTGFSTGVVAKVTIAGDTNRTATVGTTVKGSTDRYLKIDGMEWTFIVPSYSVDKLLPKPPPEEKKDAAKKAEPAKKAAEPAKKPAAPAKKAEPAKKPAAPAQKPAPAKK